MAKTKPPLQVPLDEHGGLYSYGGYEPDLSDAGEFEDTLVLDGVSRGRSAATFHWYSELRPSRTFPMFLSEMERLLKTRAVIRGRVSGRWGFCKRGSNYSIRLADAQVDPRADDLAIATAAVFGDTAAAAALADKLRE